MPFPPFWGDCPAQIETSEISSPNLQVATVSRPRELQGGAAAQYSIEGQRPLRSLGPSYLRGAASRSRRSRSQPSVNPQRFAKVAAGTPGLVAPPMRRLIRIWYLTVSCRSTSYRIWPSNERPAATADGTLVRRRPSRRCGVDQGVEKEVQRGPKSCGNGSTRE